jgi:peptide/nickel transport system permease protein/glutathione transport system permease protein
VSASFELSESAAGSGLRRRWRPPALSTAALGFLALVLLCLIAGPLVAPQDPDKQNVLLGAVPPSSAHLLGTDQLGRDVLSRLIVGTRPTLIGPLCVAVGATVIGSSLGLLAGYRGGPVEAVVGRLADLIFALPALLVAVVVIGVLGGGYLLAMAILIFLSIAWQIRVVRGAALVQARLPYVDAARTLDLSDLRIMGRHILPNILAVVVTSFLLDLVGALISFSGLAFLGLGIPAGSAAWGSMLADGQELITTNAWLSLAPAVLIVLTAASMTLIGDWVYEVLSSAHEQI